MGLFNLHRTLYFEEVLELALKFAKLRRAVIGWSSGGLSEITASQPGEVNSWVYYITHSLNHSLGYPLAVVSLIGIIYAIFAHRKKDLLLLSFPLLYYFIMGSFSRHGNRYFIPMVPFLSIIAAVFLVKQFDPSPFSPANPNPIVKIYRTK